jgi:hypothetical protein
MLDIDRRSALAIGIAGLSGLVLPEQAAAQTYGPNEGKELTQGVRQIDLGVNGGSKVGHGAAQNWASGGRFAPWRAR